MPHCILEISESISEKIDCQAILEDLHSVLAASGEFSEDAIKVRRYVSDLSLVGGIEKESVHVTLKLLSGRDITTKQQLSESLFNTVSSWLEGDDVVLTVDILDMDKDVYRK